MSLTPEIVNAVMVLGGALVAWLLNRRSPSPPSPAPGPNPAPAPSDRPLLDLLTRLLARIGPLVATAPQLIESAPVEDEPSTTVTIPVSVRLKVGVSP